jgi:hypothetical protein
MIAAPSPRIAVARARLPLAEEAAPMSAGEIAALNEASTSLEQCGEEVTKFMQPLTFFFALRNPTEDPTEAQWEKVKEKWPVLAGRSDAELKEALGPIKAVKVDFRSLKAEKKASSRFPEGYNGDPSTL